MKALLILALMGLLPQFAYSQASVDEVTEAPAELSPDEQKFLEEEFEPPKEAPYTTEVDPVTAEPVLVKKDQPQEKKSEPPVNKNAPVTYLEGSEKTAETPYRQDGLKKVSAKGEYLYEVSHTPQAYGFTFKIGPFAPPQLSNTTENGDKITFKDLYGDTQNLMFMMDIEWQFLRNFGKLALKAGTGFYSAKGNGRFKRDITLVSREEYSFYLMPNSLDAIWRLHFWERQPVIPYVFAGGNYFAFLETRDDNVPAKYGGALAANFGGGAQIALDALDRRALNELDSDYGINRVYLIGEYQRIIGLNSTYDFSNDIISGGFLLEF